MVLVTLAITVWHIFALVMKFAWPICLLSDFYLRNFEPHKRRMRRGKFWLWELRTFGIPGMFFWEIPIVTGCLAAFFTLHTVGLIYLWWAYVGITCAIDWITGSDDPPYRRWLAEAVKKLKISPPPRPVIDLS